MESCFRILENNTNGEKTSEEQDNQGTRSGGHVSSHWEDKTKQFAVRVTYRGSSTCFRRLSARRRLTGATLEGLRMKRGYNSEVLRAEESRGDKEVAQHKEIKTLLD